MNQVLTVEEALITIERLLDTIPVSGKNNMKTMGSVYGILDACLQEIAKGKEAVQTESSKPTV